MTTPAAQRDRWITGAFGLAAIIGGALMVIGRGEWIVWGLGLVATTLGLGGLDYSIGKARG